ncbi:16680_t:CDS:1, partial [Dentiscutata erythropus]
MPMPKLYLDDLFETLDSVLVSACRLFQLCDEEIEKTFMQYLL